MTSRCESCGCLIDKKPTGRPAKNCSSCRKSLQEAYKNKNVGSSRKLVNVDKDYYENER